ncbi:hypothetical protein QBC36DRAFT_291108 [Triangularia setosa]|uniref:Uncharacterized protein n=1 Tax=Triangularia setosa TaxID=2587417 RepID=A0AAN6W684_9PEZI|nr:hypothetical protein QBC36DRAFT_291108 [Podospora setosa]
MDPVHAEKVQEYTGLGSPVPVTMKKKSILRLSSVLAELMLFSCRKENHHIGLVVLNAWGSVVYTWRLYNALKNEKLLSRT